MGSKIKKWPHRCDPECQQRTLQGLISTFILILLVTMYGKYLYVTHHKEISVHETTATESDRMKSETVHNTYSDHASNLLQNIERQTEIHENEPDLKNKCEQQICDIYYIKVHKTGSTTLQNILYRFGMSRELLIASYDCGNGMPYPNPPYKRFLNGNHTNYNIMCEHAQYDNKSFREYMSPDVKIISLLRHPLEFLQSTISFHGLTNRMRLSAARDVTKAFLLNPEVYDTLARFEGSSKHCGPFRNPSYTRNAMAHHFGLAYQAEHNPNVIQKFLRNLDKQVTFVLMLEKFDEGLILLKRMFNWSLKDIMYIPLWSLKFHNKKDIRKIRTQNETEALIELHKKWSPVDYELYDHYNKSLHSILQKMPADYWNEVKVFKQYVVKVKAFCASMCYEDVNKILKMSRDEALTFLLRHKAVIDVSDFNDVFHVTYLDCIKMSQATIKYQTAIKIKQNPALCEKRGNKFQKAYCDRNDYLDNRLPWSLVKHSLFVTRMGCLKNFSN